VICLSGKALAIFIAYVKPATPEPITRKSVCIEVAKLASALKAA
jgi:hypothetical protein